MSRRTYTEVHQFAAEVLARVSMDIDAGYYMADRPTHDYDYMLHSFSDLHDSRLCGTVRLSVTIERG